MPEFDVNGFPAAPFTKTRTQWAVVIDGTFNGHPGLHVLGVQGEREARNRLAAWQDRPEANARLIRREVVETAGEWSPA
jgi:hypothetical protein